MLLLAISVLNVWIDSGLLLKHEHDGYFAIEILQRSRGFGPSDLILIQYISLPALCISWSSRW